MRNLSIDIETYSGANLSKCGVYRYSDAPDFEILLFSYAYGDRPVQTVDLACGERLPVDVLAAFAGVAWCGARDVPRAAGWAGGWPGEREAG